ncbi:Bystin-domain-containing protein [Globomyces pollinis-pini]|nr:Bystin-domain-containing protein [Globomyces pollinis-pini]
MPKSKSKQSTKERHDPLHIQLENDASVANSVKPIKTKNKKSNVQEVESTTMDSKTSSKILKMVKEQQLELAEDDVKSFKKSPSITKPTKNYELDDDEDEINSDDEKDFEEWNDGDTGLNIDENDQALIEKFMNPEPKKSLNLSDLIMSKINAANTADALENAGPEVPPGLNPKVVEVYTKVGMLLSRYKSGPLPKTFKIIPTLRDWEEVLYITNPDAWSPQALYQATRIFTSNLKSKMAQRLYKPAAFFKGFLLPLCESGTCTLREAAIIGSVLIKVSVPVLHSAAALLKIAEMEYTGSWIKQDDREMPVLWHQSLLVFAQRYKEDMTPEQKEALLDLLKYKIHSEITAEIRREIQNSVCRGEMKPDQDVEILSSTIRLMLNATANSIKRYVIVSFFYILFDMFLVIFGDIPYHNMDLVIIGYIVHILFVGYVTVSFMFRFTFTFPFQAGMIKIIFQEFKTECTIGILYSFMTLLFRIKNMWSVLPCNFQRCSISNSLFDKILVVLFRTSSALFYYHLQNGVIRLCDEKYYCYSDWFQSKSLDLPLSV